MYIFKFFVILLCTFCLISWVQNVVKLSECDFKAPYKAEVIYGIGVITPAGIVTGWLDLGK